MLQDRKVVEDPLWFHDRLEDSVRREHCRVLGGQRTRRSVMVRFVALQFETVPEIFEDWLSGKPRNGRYVVSESLK